MIDRKQGRGESSKINIKNEQTKIRADHIDLPEFELNIEKLCIIEIIKVNLFVI